ncbi:hypothetical protein EV641_104220 [Rhodococcus sp. SMB37]|nr:hypothetical protein EV641_104220 [Rhodococcus sp. SMB37]
MICDTPLSVVAGGAQREQYRVMSAPWDDDGGFAWEQREAGRTWDQIGAELGCPAHVARELGERYHAEYTALALRDQLPLFDVPGGGGSRMT